MAGSIAISVNSELIGELFDRLGPDTNIDTIIESLLEGFLERTEYDDDMWRWEWVERREQRDLEHQAEEFGPYGQGYRWGPLLLENGTRIRMSYQGTEHSAWVKHGEIVYDGDTYSPSQFAAKIANNTARNAWRDLSIQLPGERSPIKAEDLRRKAEWKK